MAEKRARVEESDKSDKCNKDFEKSLAVLVNVTSGEGGVETYLVHLAEIPKDTQVAFAELVQKGWKARTAAWRHVYHWMDAAMNDSPKQRKAKGVVQLVDENEFDGCAFPPDVPLFGIVNYTWSSEHEFLCETESESEDE